MQVPSHKPKVIKIPEISHFDFSGTATQKKHQGPATQIKHLFLSFDIPIRNM
jgi:hypothetical protein